VTRAEDWRRQFTTKHVCKVCGERATMITDRGWMCERHRYAEIPELSS
jgi:hypothetical protein